MIKLNSKIYVAGHTGLVGSAILRRLRQKGYKNIITISRKKLNLKDQNKVFSIKWELHGNGKVYKPGDPMCYRLQSKYMYMIKITSTDT